MNNSESPQKTLAFDKENPSADISKGGTTKSMVQSDEYSD
jgi:hypothetical protein